MKEENIGKRVDRAIATFLFIAMSVILSPAALFFNPHPLLVATSLAITGIAHLSFSSYDREYKDVLLVEAEKTWVSALLIIPFGWVLIPIDAVTWTFELPGRIVGWLDRKFDMFSE